MKKHILTICLAVTAFLFSCNKEQHIIQPQPSPTGTKNITKAGRLDTYPLDWENIDRMPVPPGTTPVGMPWGGLSSRQLTLEMIYDYRKRDGWELLYNTFSTEYREGSLFFMLYNKYRGLIRLYYYVRPDANYIASANIVHKLATEGPHSVNSPILNFAGQNIVDVNKNVTATSILEPFQVAPDTWYAFQYELAYDKNVVNQTFSTFNFLWPIRSTQIQTAKLNGNIDGSLKGRIKFPENSVDVTNNINITNATGQVIVNGTSEATNLLKSLGSAVVDGAKKAITKGVSGLVEGLFSGIFGNKSNEENVSLTLDAKIDLSGTLTQDFLVRSTAFPVSGHDQSGTVGFSPAYNKPLGVFYLGRRPIINLTTILEPIPGGGTGRGDGFKRTREYVIEPAQYIFNPAVLDAADIVVKEERLIGRVNGSTIITGNDIKTEVINGQTYWTATRIVTERLDTAVDIYSLYYRIVIDVIPKDGSPKVTIVKTFRPDIVNF